MPSESVVTVSELTRRFGATTALASVTLSMARGAVYGLVGANGAGKTTLIKHILGLLRAESGSVRVFGRDPVADPVGVLSRIGYLSEENDLPGWMRMDELIRYSRAFYPAWDDAYADELRQAFALDPTAKIKNLSRGQKARAGLLVALAHRPELLVLDEPSSGLDPIVRRDILGAVIRTIAHEGRTVLFSWCGRPTTCPSCRWSGYPLTTSEQIGQMDEVLHCGDRSRRDIPQKPGESLDGRLRDRVPRHELHFDVTVHLRAGVQSCSKQIVDCSLVRVDDSCADSGLGKRAGEEVFPIAVVRAGKTGDDWHVRKLHLLDPRSDPPDDLRPRSRSFTIFGDCVGETGAGLTDDARRRHSPRFEQPRVCARVDCRLRSEDHGRAPRIGFKFRL